VLALHVGFVGAFDAEDCPGECHCTMDGLLMLVDCAGLGLTELPKFPDNQVKLLCQII
jgi:Leucine rich repeat N-terminal domain